MGNMPWEPTKYAQYSASTSKKSREEIFQRKSIHEDLDPSRIKFRECVDSEANPSTTPIIVCSDVTGSMGMLAEVLAKQGLGTIMNQICDRKPVPNPQVCSMAVGDAYCDSAPLQVTQFESGVDPMTKQLENFYIEGGGGGNGGESYLMAWWFAAFKCYTDNWQKRGKKGFLFTIGDEWCHDALKKDQIIDHLGVPAETDMSRETALSEVQKNWEVFHLIVKPIAGYVTESWKELLGERAIVVEDHNHIAEGIVATIQLVAGHSAQDVEAGWDGHASSRIVKSTIRQLTGA